MNERTEVADARSSGRRLAFGAGIMGVVSILKMLMQAATLPIMARLLGPSELGLYALAFPIVAFVTMLADGGLGISLAREPLNSPVWSTAFWVLLLAGVFLSIVLTGIGFGEGYILHQPRIPGLMAALSVTVVLLTITVPSTARLDRHGRLGVGAIGDLVGNIIGMAVGVICAFQGDGAWSLAAQYLTVFFVRSVIINYFGFAWPKMEFYPRLLFAHIATGGLLVASRMTDYFTRTVENLVVGQALGRATLGQYAFSTQITRYLAEMVGNPVWMTLYIRALRADQTEAASYHLQMSRALGLVLFPITALVVTTAPAIVPVFLGTKWITAIPLIQIMLPSYVLVMVASLIGAPLLAAGQYKWQFYGQLLMCVGRVIAVCLSPWIGIVGTAYGITGVSIVYAIYMLFFPAVMIGCRPLHIFEYLIFPFLASLAAAIVSALLLPKIHATLLQLFFALIAGGIAYVIAVFLMDQKRLRQDISLVKQVLWKGPI